MKFKETFLSFQRLFSIKKKNQSKITYKIVLYS